MGNNDNWLSDEPLDDWYGVSVSDGRVARLDLDDNQLTGSIPRSWVTSLASRGWTQPQPADGIHPPELGDLSSLTLLYLHFNQLTGSIPPELGELFG